MTWIYMVHTDHGGGALFPDEPGVIDSQKARGWVIKDMPIELDPDAPNSGLINIPEPEPPTETSGKITAPKIAKKANSDDKEGDE